jgi:uncharacterized protein with HEPN domain
VPIIIGEAAINVPTEIQVLAPEIPWRLMSDMRNIVAHEHFYINLRNKCRRGNDAADI